MTQYGEVIKPGKLEVIAHASPGVCPAQSVLVRKTVVPGKPENAGEPETGLTVTTPAAALTVSGTVIAEIETNSAEVSSTTNNREPDLLANLRHVTIVRRSGLI